MCQTLVKHTNEVCKGRWTLQIIYHNTATERAAKTVEVFNGCLAITPDYGKLASNLQFIMSWKESNVQTAQKLNWNEKSENKYSTNIEGVSRLVDITAGGNFLGLCDQKCSYKHVSDFGRLRIYGHFLIPVHTLVRTASYGNSWRMMYSTWWLIVCGSCNDQLAQFTTERQPVVRPAVAFSKTSFKHRSIQIKGNYTKVTLHLYFKCITYYAGLLFCFVYCQ